jgi:arginine exporter protein ArgO
MIGAVAAGLIAGLGIAMPVGAIGTYLIALGARAPRPVAAAAAFGVASTDGAYASIAVAGGAALADVLRPISGVLEVTSAVALLLLSAMTAAAALRRFRRVHGDDAASVRTATRPRNAYLALLAVTAINPATLAYFTALVLGGQGNLAAGPAERALFVAAVFVASAAWQLLLVAAGAGLGSVAGGRRGRLAVALASSAVMLALAVRVAT